MPTEETGPATLTTVKGRLGYAEGDATEDTDLTVIVLAVNDFVTGLPVAQGQDGTEEKPWAARVVLGATLLAMRLYHRRDSPGGVEGFGTDGALYVRTNDPDIGLMLQLGSNAKPSVG